VKEFFTIAAAIALTSTLTQEPRLYIATMAFLALGVIAAITD